MSHPTTGTTQTGSHCGRPWSEVLRQPAPGANTIHAAQDPLGRIVAREVRPIVLVTGSLDDYRSLERLSDRPNEQARLCATPSSRVIERTSALFAFRSEEETHCGVTWDDLADCYAGNNFLAKLIFVGPKGNVPYAAEAIKSAVPHFPVAVIDLSPEAPSPNSKHYLGCPVSSAALSVHSTPSDIHQIVSDTATRCVDLAATGAFRLLAPVRLTNSGAPIPASVYDCMERKLIPEALAANLHILLRGGCGIVAFMPQARPISLDIDFTALLKVAEFDRFKTLMRAVCEDGYFEVRGCPSLSGSNRSTYLKGKVTISEPNKTEVSLDAVAVRRVPGDLFSYEFKYDEVMNRYHRIAQLDSGAIIGVVAPELSLIEKLVAGRGRELGKYDILDAAGILANQPLELHLIQRIIERQRYDDKLDGHIESSALRVDRADRQLQELGIVSDLALRLCILKALHNNKLFSPRHNDLRERGPVYHIFTPDALKKIGLVSKLLKGLEAVERSANEIDNRLNPPSSASELWGERNIDAGVRCLREFLYSYAEHQLLRKDLYVHRNSKSLERAEEFWASDKNGEQTTP